MSQESMPGRVARTVETKTIGSKTQEELKITEILHAPKVLEYINTLDPKARDKMIGSFIRFAFLTTENQINEPEELLESFIDNLKTVDTSKMYDPGTKTSRRFIVLDLCRKIALREKPEQKGVDVMGDFKDPFTEEVWRKYFNLTLNSYHSFNTSVETSIRKEGLRALDVFESDPDIREVQEIFGENPSNSMLFSWGSFQERAVYSSGNPDTAYDYAYRSPEWFSGFVGGNIDYFTNDEEKLFVRRQAYYLKDKDQCEQNIHYLCDKRKLNEAQRAKVLGLFNKYWDIYASPSSGNGLASFKTVDNPVEIEKQFASTYQGAQKRARFDVNYFFEPDTDRRDRAIDPKKLTIVHLPAYADIYPEYVKKYKELKANK